MSVTSPSLAAVRQCLLPRLAALCVGLLVALTIGVTVAHAEGWGGRMPAKTWSTNGVYDPSLHFFDIEISSGPTSSCVAPAQRSGGSWVFPYGWSCGSGNARLAEFPSTGAYPAVDNPNSQPFNFGLLYF